jgi:hypothetical protein
MYMAALAALVTTMTEWKWPIISAFVAVIALSAFVYVNIIRPRLRRWRLRQPVEPFFRITSLNLGITTYATQDSEQHEIKELVLKSHSTANILILLIPKVPFRSSNMTLEIGGRALLDTKPYITESFNPFIKEGAGKRVVPGESNNKHYIDIYHHYHAKQDRTWTVGNDVVAGFILKTRDSGVFPLVIRFSGEDVEGRVKLTIRVEDSPTTSMRCVSRKHKNRTCNIRPK